MKVVLDMSVRGRVRVLVRADHGECTKIRLGTGNWKEASHPECEGHWHGARLDLADESSKVEAQQITMSQALWLIDSHLSYERTIFPDNPPLQTTAELEQRGNTR